MPRQRLAGLASPAILIPLLLLPLLGCPPDDGAVPVTFPTPATATATGPTGAAEPASSEEATATPTQRAADAQVARICLLLPATGPSKDVGAEMRRGIAIAQARVGEGDANRVFEWTERDTKSTEPGAITAFQACFNEGYSIFIGPVHPAATTALIPVAAAHEVTLVIPELGAAQASAWGKNLVAIAPLATDMGRIAAVDAAKERGLKRAAILHVPKVFGESLAAAFAEEFVANGGKITETREVPVDATDSWRKIAKQVVQAGAEGVFVIGPPAAAEAIAGTLRDDSMTSAHVWFIDWAMHPPVLAAAGAQARGRVHWVNRPLPSGAFAEAYTKRYQARPEYAAGAGYDAVLVATSAALEAESLWFENVSKAATEAKGIASAFGNGSIVAARGIVSEDVAGYRMVEPVQLKSSGEWVFDGFE